MSEEDLDHLELQIARMGAAALDERLIYLERLRDFRTTAMRLEEEAETLLTTARTLYIAINKAIDERST
jgi:hypothetical protein